MSRLAKLVARSEELSKEIDNLIDVALEASRGLSDEENTKKEELEAQIKEVDSLIELEKEQEKRRESLSAPVAKAPKIEVIREDKHDEDGNCRAYNEFNKGGFGQFLKDVALASGQGRVSEELKAVQLAATGANETVGSEGGFLPQADHAELLFAETVASGQIASECRQIKTSSNRFTANLIDQTSRASGSRYGGVQSYRRAEAGSVTATKPKLRQTDMKVEALEALYYATEELLEDVPALQTLVTPMFTEEMAWKIDDEIISGTGTNGECLGILNSPALISIAKEGGQTADTVVYNNIDKIADRGLVSSDPRMKWYIHPDVRQQLRNIEKNGTNSDVFPYIENGGGLNQPASLFNKPVIRVEQCKALGDLGDIILADFSRYLLVRRTGIAASQSMHVAFLTSERVFKWTARVTGEPMDNSPLTDAYGSTTRSAFVSLAERA